MYAYHVLQDKSKLCLRTLPFELPFPERTGEVIALGVGLQHLRQSKN